MWPGNPSWVMRNFFCVPFRPSFTPFLDIPSPVQTYFFPLQKTNPVSEKQRETLEHSLHQVWWRTPNLWYPAQRTTIQQWQNWRLGELKTTTVISWKVLSRTRLVRNNTVTQFCGFIYFFRFVHLSEHNTVTQKLCLFCGFIYFSRPVHFFRPVHLSGLTDHRLSRNTRFLNVVYYETIKQDLHGGKFIINRESES
jgi:hypothetical protein